MNKCIFCSLYVKEGLKNGRCKECDIEYNNVVTKIMKRYSIALKNLADR